VLVANYGDKAEFRDDPEHMRSNIGAARVVADVLRKLFFPSVRTDDPSLDGYPRNRKSPISFAV